MRYYLAWEKLSILDIKRQLAKHSLYISPVASAQGAKPPQCGFCFFGGTV